MWFALWSLREDVYLEPVGDRLILHSRWEDVSVPMPGPWVAEALRRMCLGPISLGNVITRDDDRDELSRVLEGIQHLVIRSFGPDQEQALISVVPASPHAVFRLAPLRDDLPVRLSRFVSIQTGEREWRMESPLSLHRVLLHKPGAMAMVGALGWPAPPAELPADARHLAACLVATGMAAQEFDEDSDPVLAMWNPIDLMFHSQATLGRHDHDSGATYRLGGLAVEPVVKPPVGDHIDLRRPRWPELVAHDPPLSAVLEAANGAAARPERVPSIDDLGELLYRAARVRSLIGAADATAATATSDRPYRSAGDCYAIEIYITAAGCAGLPDGNYHYDPLAHRLHRIGGDGDDPPPSPAVRITLTARFRRSSWKYDGLSYALILKDVGALTQTLTLVGTAMGLSVCVVDGDDVELSSRAPGLDWTVESSVGGLVVGRSCGAGPDGAHVRHPVNDAAWPAKAVEFIR